ncbi:MAG: ABC transporter substrate-binding protein, partial [Herminiimonas sp.]|nr:ABC transporter substrate-binding protein [Herminiimonas sp.]
MIRMGLIATALAAWLSFGSAQADEIRIGTVSGITGPLSMTTADILSITTGYLDMINAQGGVNGNTLKLFTRDDGYDPKKTAELVEDIVAKDKVVALVNGAGTANTAALIKAGVLTKHQLPLVGVYSGSEAIRGPGSEQIFHTRVTYNEEIAKIARMVSTLGLKRVAVLYQDDGFGAGIIESVTKFSEVSKFDIVQKTKYKAGEQNF